MSDNRPYLDDREIAILQMRYKENGENKTTLSEIGSKFNLTRERVRTIIVGAEKKQSRWHKCLGCNFHGYYHVFREGLCIDCWMKKAKTPPLRD